MMLRNVMIPPSCASTETYAMAAGRPNAVEKLEHDPSSPSTVHTDDFGGSPDHDHEANIGASASQQRSCGLLAPFSHRNRLTSLLGTWRAWLGIREPNHVPDIEKTITRQREQSIGLV